ncbi:hypothetical protein RJ639_025488, partial [Escallonia herrerae]
MQNGFDFDVYIGSALVDMYAKCGSLDKSLVVFFKLQEKNLFCWNSAIEGLAAHGYAHKALTMFTRMEMEKVKPNGITFVSVLSSCTHAGLVEEGRRRFLNMTCHYFIAPEIEHYGCMVDLLCKAGLLEDALELIRTMKMEPNAVIWGTLLGGCKLHKNLDIAQVAGNNLMVLEPNNSGYHTLLVHMYAEANRWNEVAKIRAKMRELGVEKTSPGSSWIKMERKIHHFAASDKDHPASDEIYSLLGVLDGQLKLFGNRRMKLKRQWDGRGKTALETGCGRSTSTEGKHLIPLSWSLLRGELLISCVDLHPNGPKRIKQKFGASLEWKSTDASVKWIVILNVEQYEMKLKSQCDVTLFVCIASLDSDSGAE